MMTKSFGTTKKRREYTVRSGYQVAMKIKFYDSPSISSNASDMLKVLWSVAVPAKVRIFMWKALSNFLPIATNLVKRKVIDMLLCSRCFCDMEDVEHTLNSVQIC